MSPQQPAFSGGSQQVACFSVEQHEEASLAAPVPAKKRLRFSGTSTNGVFSLCAVPEGPTSARIASTIRAVGASVCRSPR